MTVLTQMHPNEVARQLTGRSYTSWSALTTYMACPLRYALRYVAGLPEETVAASLVFGGAVHRAAEVHFQSLRANGTPAPLEALMAGYEAAWQDHAGANVQFGKGDDRASLAALAQRMLTAFQAHPAAAPSGEILEIEQEFLSSVVPGAPDVLARVDLLVDAGDALVVTDLKTARSRWSEEQVEQAAGQLLLYHELVKPFADGRPVRLEFLVLTKTKVPEVTPYPIDFDNCQLDRLRKTVARVWRAIAGEVFYPAPSAMKCPGCPYREACRGWSG